MSMEQKVPKGNRRRRPLAEEGSDFYDDSDDENKGHRAASDKIYGSTCSIGQFFLNPCLCIWTMMSLSCQRQYVTKIRRRLKPLHAMLLIPLFLLLKYAFSYTSMIQPHPLRPRSDAQVNNLQVVIPSLDSTNQIDLGGWFSPVPFSRPEQPMLLKTDKNIKVVDFGTLNLKSTKQGRFNRVIHPDDRDRYEDERLRQLNRMDLEPTVEKYDHDDEQDYKECRRPNWKSAYYPNCNAFHEMGMERIYDTHITSLVDKAYDSYLFSHGYYRDAWLVDNVEKHERAVLKTVRMKHDYTPRIFTNVQRDAVIMERLTSSPYIVKMFGHCAASLTVQPIDFEIEEYIVPGEGYSKQEDLLDEDDVQPRNDYTPSEKLEIALDMARSLSVLHGYEGGVIVHDDVQLCQWLRNRKNKLVLGDFNRAEIRDWNEEKGEYCKHTNGYAYGNYRAPEEFAGKELDEQIDVFSLGNNVYALMTGLWPFYENEDDTVVQNELVDGKNAFIDNRYRTRSYGEGKMVELIEMCWQFQPEDRPDIFEIIRFLERAYDEAKFRESLGQQKASNY